MSRGFTRDHVLTALVGILAGFIAGYFVGQKQPAAPGGSAGMPAGASAPIANPEGQQIPPDLRAKIAQLEQAHEANPSDPKVTLQLGHAYYDSAQWEKARAKYEEVLPVMPEDPNLLTDLGVVYRSLGQPEKALELFEKAAKIDPNHWQSRYNQAVVYSFDRRNLEKAKAILAELKKNPAAREPAEKLEQAVDVHAGAGSAMPGMGNPGQK